MRLKAFVLIAAFAGLYTAVAAQHGGHDHGPGHGHGHGSHRKHKHKVPSQGNGKYAEFGNGAFERFGISHEEVEKDSSDSHKPSKQYLADHSAFVAAFKAGKPTDGVMTMGAGPVRRSIATARPPPGGHRPPYVDPEAVKVHFRQHLGKGHPSPNLHRREPLAESEIEQEQLYLAKRHPMDPPGVYSNAGAPPDWRKNPRLRKLAGYHKHKHPYDRKWNRLTRREDEDGHKDAALADTWKRRYRQSAPEEHEGDHQKHEHHGK